MVQVWLYFLIESILFPLMAWYVEQVTGAGTGVKRHPLFFLGMNHAENMVENKKKKEKRGIFGLWRRKKQPKNRQAEQNGKGAGAQLSTSSPGTPSAAGMGPAVTAPKHEEIQSPSLDYYYGPSTQAAAPSPGLLEGLDPEFRSPKDPSHLLAGKPVPRRITSVKLGVVPEDFVDVGVGNGKQDVNGDLDNDEGYDVAAERARVEAMYRQWAADRSVAPPSAILLHNLRKVYPSRGGGPKVAVRSLSLGIERRECFGLLGPNGAGKTTTIRMMEGFLDPTSGAAIIEGYSIPKDVDSIYSLMGACPQHDLLWEGLTGREHLLFYGRIKNLGGPELQKAVDAGLRKVNLFTVGDSLVSNYSGGMKRRLSVAISLMGDPKVVYFDEPSTGLDPSSRRLLWEVIKEARRTKAVVLTTHSMEEAESLCDRLGIFVNGKLQCVGNPKDLTARFGGYLSFTVTTPAHQETAAEGVVRSMAPGARLVYSLGGTQKFELPLREIGVEGVFRRMEEVKLRKELDVMDWGVSNATLEEVFIKITKDAGVKMSAFTQGQGGGAHDLNLNGASSV